MLGPSLRMGRKWEYPRPPPPPPSLSQPNIQWSDKQQSPCVGDGGGGGLKFEKRARKTMKSTHTKKKLGIGSSVFCTFFIHPNQTT